MPSSLNVPTLGILAATLVDFGTHEQKARHLPAILKGEELWVQFLSEPSGGSDLAGCLTRADRDGDVFIMNGSKIWSSGAAESDYAMCLARTNWDVPKHRGLTMFIVKIHQPGIQVEQIRQVDGSMEFCQEFFDDVRHPRQPTWWARSTTAGRSPRACSCTSATRSAAARRTRAAATRATTHPRDENPYAEFARAAGRTADSHTRQLVGEAHIRQLVGGQLIRRVTQGVTVGKMAPPAGSLLKLFSATNVMRRYEIGLELAGGRSGGVARRHRAVRASASARSASGARASRSAGAATRSSATSSASACSACPASSPPTARCPTATCPAAGRSRA